ncbi:MAG: 2-hydroxyacyl-CoA dehydratase family protein [Candidatus Methanoperedens sp.]
MSNNGSLSYPEELKQQFIETNDLNYRDGTIVTAADIWKYMTEEAPKKFPYAFEFGRNNNYLLSEDVEYFSGIKAGYLTLSLKDFLINAHKKGTPLVHVIGGQIMDAYYAAGGIAFRTALVGQAVRSPHDGANLRKVALYAQELEEKGKRAYSYELCGPALRMRGTIDEGLVPIDLLAPFNCIRCSDMARMVESYRDKFPNISLDCPIVDYENKEWAVDYLSSQLHTLTKKVSDLSGKKITDNDVLKEIKLENKARKLARDIYDIWWSAKVPPTNSVDIGEVSQLATDFRGDPLAAIGVLEETKEEIKERVKHSIKGKGLVDDPIRLYVSGMGAGNRRRIDRMGGLLVGADQGWNAISVNVKESGDPYENLANGMLSLPLEQPIERRAELAVEQVKKSKADGVVVTIAWGCNYSSAVVRILADTIKERTGVPTVIFETTPGVEGAEQIENRTESFIEMLKLRVN